MISFLGALLKKKSPKSERSQIALFVSSKYNKKKGKIFNPKAPKTAQSRKSDRNKGVNSPTSITKKIIKCFFYKKKSHKKSDRPKYKIWLAKNEHKGNSLALLSCMNPVWLWPHLDPGG